MTKDRAGSPYDPQQQKNFVMNRLLPILLLVFACLVPACYAQQDISQTRLLAIEVYFSPKGGCTEAVVRELNAAKTSVLVQALLDAPVLPAHEAVIRGVKRWMVWCRHCERWQRHGAAEGHRDAHCDSPYLINLAYAGEWREHGSQGRPDSPIEREDFQ
jgi:hypothetical protein